ncbi:hypothetical protein J9303_17145 [Bacillaceae bacterium Marseille-Q3522]|nr:hypothetical protein [Bacillaceae bacterium Marseille-Q3522]
MKRFKKIIISGFMSILLLSGFGLFVDETSAASITANPYSQTINGDVAYAVWPRVQWSGIGPFDVAYHVGIGDVTVDVADDAYYTYDYFRFKYVLGSESSKTFYGRFLVTDLHEFDSFDVIVRQIR